MKRAISFAGCQLGEVRHICAFFHSADEEYRVLLPFIKEGFERGDKPVHVVNPDQHHDHMQRLNRGRDRPGGRPTKRSIRASHQHGNVPSRRPFRSGSDARGFRAGGQRQ